MLIVSRPVQQGVTRWDMGRAGPRLPDAESDKLEASYIYGVRLD